MEHWAPKGKPLMTKQRYNEGKLVVVCGFISVEEGKIMMRIRERGSYKGVDIAKFLAELTKKVPTRDNVAFGDNAKIHGKAAEEMAEISNLDLMFNIPYRPD